MGRSKGKYYAKNAGEVSSFDGYVTISDAPDTLRIPDSIPLTNGVGGEVIGTAQVRVENGGISVSGNITDAKMLQKLEMPAGSFSMAVDTRAKKLLCTPCSYDKCDMLVDAAMNCLCCHNGHVV